MQTAYAVLCQPQYWANSVMKWVTLNLLKVRAGYWNPLTCSQYVYVMLVYLFLFAVASLCCHMLWYSWSGQRWSNLHWSAPRYALFTFADNTALPGFLYFYIRDVVYLKPETKPFTQNAYLLHFLEVNVSSLHSRLTQESPKPCKIHVSSTLKKHVALLD